MKSTSVAALAIVVALAGCAAPAADVVPADAPALAALPEPIHDARDVAANGGPVVLGVGACTPTRPCFDTPFTLPRAAHVDATLSWAGAANGFKLDVLRDGQLVASATPALQATSLVLATDLEAGEHVLRVQPMRAVADAYALDAVFTEVVRAARSPCPADDALPATTSGACAFVLGSRDLRDREVHIATHPTDPLAAVATWRQGEFGAAPRILSAFTRDGGATWTTTTMENRGIEPGEHAHAYDSIAAFGGDGTAYVLYGGDRTYTVPDIGLQPLERLTLAQTRDGEAWTYRTIYETPIGVASPDYPDLGLSPDGRRMVVVTQNFAEGNFEGIWSMHSDDAGVTWSTPQIVHRPMPPPMPRHYNPRVTVGDDGLVVLATNAIENGVGPTGPEGPVTAYVSISRDGGATFGEPRRMLTYGGSYDGKGGALINDPVVIHGERITLAYADGARLVGFRSEDAGETWSNAIELATLPEVAIYAAATGGADGSVALMAQYGHAERFGIALLRWTDAGARLDVQHDVAQDGSWAVGDDYGAVGIAADGRVWTSWAQPDGPQRDDVWVVRGPLITEVAQG